MAKENPCLTLPQILAEEFERLHGQPVTLDPAATPAVQLKQYWSAVHALAEKPAALCLSGGGIRSATFALGILQGLARAGILQKFHYLSTVSGGGYIGAWLTAWIQNAERGLGEVVAKLAQPRRDTRPNPEPEPIRNLRSYSNYLAPRLGLFSADSWTLVGTYLRNLLLNWLFLIPLLAAVLTVPWIYSSFLMMHPPPYTMGLLWTGGFFLVIAIAFMGINLPCGGNKRAGQPAFLAFCALPTLISAILMTIHWAWFRNYARPLVEWSFLGLTAPHPAVAFIYLGITLHLASWATSLFRAHGFHLKEFLAVIFSGGIGGWLFWFGAAKIFDQPLAVAELYTVFAIPIFFSFFFLAILVFAGISSRWTDDPDREWWGRAAGWFLALGLGWILLSTLVVFGPLLLSWSFTTAISTLSLGGLGGLLTILAGRSSSVPATKGAEAEASRAGIVFSLAGRGAALLFVAVLMILITQSTTGLVQLIGESLAVPWDLEAVSFVVGRQVEYLNVILYTPWWLIGAVALGLVAFAFAMAHLINPNKFSLHAMYRDRLIRAYLGASNRRRDPNPFTGFDEHDNPPMADLWKTEKAGRRLLPIINLALNLVGGSNLAWQERKAASFTISPLHCGSHVVGYRNTQVGAAPRYGGKKGVSLGTAITISGAAASPNMGYHSSAVVTFILTLLNVRLGAWLGNPGPAGDNTYHLSYPNFSVRPIVSEALGLTNETNPYVYLSDGGHFDNLGLYEMILRRCHYIVISDAGADPCCSFQDLGGAVRKIRIDLGISIAFDEIKIFSRDEELAEGIDGRHAAIGKIRYSEVDGPDAPDGVIVYLKPACYGREPRDIYEYFKSNRTFPHESTADQFFTESQFESYRMLGLHTMEQLAPGKVGDFEEFVDSVRRHLGGPFQNLPSSRKVPAAPPAPEHESI